MRERETRPPSPRQLRVGEAIRHALAHALERGEVRDPGLGGKSVTVTEVRVSPDLRHATAFVVPFNAPSAAAVPPADLRAPGARRDMDSHDAAAAMTEVVAALNRAAPFLRHRVAEAVRTRFAPELVFRADITFDEAERIHRIFADPLVARDVGRAPPGAQAPTNIDPAAIVAPGFRSGRPAPPGAQAPTNIDPAAIVAPGFRSGRPAPPARKAARKRRDPR
jgi:ribosome-binding factor A